MAWTVLLTEGVERDIEDIFRFVAAKGSTARALRVLDALEDACAKLGAFPTRGNVPKELRAIGLSITGKSTGSHTASSIALWTNKFWSIACSTAAATCRRFFMTACSADRDAF
jgi:plasmid stabilization system protein ParE